MEKGTLLTINLSTRQADVVTAPPPPSPSQSPKQRLNTKLKNSAPYIILKKIRKSAIGNSSDDKKSIGTRKVYGSGVDSTVSNVNHPVNQLIAKIKKGGRDEIESVGDGFSIGS